MSGVVVHVPNPDPATVAGLAASAEEAGAAWVGLADAFWWRDVWMLLAEAARSTGSIALGPLCTNPFLRHPFHTVAATATLQDLAGPRVFVGLAAGGSEIGGAARVSRREAPERVEALAALLRSVAAGAPLDAASGRRLDVALDRPEVVVAARGDRMLAAAGRCADRVLLWGVPRSDLARTVGAVRAAASGRPVRLTWAPLVAHDDAEVDHARTVAVYAALNSRRALREGWGLDDATRAALRGVLVAEGASAAVDLVPDAALCDLVLDDPDPATVAAAARRLGLDDVAVPVFETGAVSDRVRWAAAVEDLLA